MQQTTPQTHWRFDWLQGLAVGLVLVLAGFAMGLGPTNGSHANGVTSLSAIDVQLADDQPDQIVQDLNQRLASFELSTTSTVPVTVSGVAIHSQGSLHTQIAKYFFLYPLTVVATADGAEVGQGRGELWIYGGEYFTQGVNFDSPLSLVVGSPIVLSAYADLTGQTQETFEVSLVEVWADATVADLPVAGRLFEIKERL